MLHDKKHTLDTIIFVTSRPPIVAAHIFAHWLAFIVRRRHHGIAVACVLSYFVTLNRHLLGGAVESRRHYHQRHPHRDLSSTAMVTVFVFVYRVFLHHSINVYVYMFFFLQKANREK